MLYLFTLSIFYRFTLTTDQEVWGSNPYECTKSA